MRGIPAGAIRNLPGRALLVSTLVLLCWGCGAQEADQPAAARIGDAATPAADPLPGLGRALIEFADGQVTVLSQAAPRSEILEELAAKAGIALELGELAPSRLTLRIDDLALERALPLLLRDVPYQVEYTFDRALGRHVVTFLGVGPAPMKTGFDTIRKSDEAPAPRPATRPDREFRERLFRERVLREAPIQAALLEDLESPNAVTRAEAASKIEAEGPALDRLLEILAEDPDPRVRATAVQQLGDAGSHWAVRGLIYALGDAEPEVVLRAIEELELEGDESVVPDLEPLLDHRDAAIREAAREAVESLE